MKKIISSLMATLFLFAVLLGYMPSTTTDAATAHHAYMGIQTNNTLWVFRNAFDDKTYGLGTDAFKSLSSVSGKTVTKYNGTFKDANITKDGTYTVSLDKPDFAGETTMSQLFVSTDIPMSQYIKVTNVQVKIDGSTVYTFKKGAINQESVNYVQIMCLNIWNPDVKDLFSANVPTSKCEITFTISGIDKAEAEKKSLKDYTFRLYKDSASVSGYTGKATTVKLPSNVFAKPVTDIGQGAFQKSSVKSITLPDTVKTIGKSAFAGSKLTSITLPKNVTSIGDGAFDGCSNLTKIVIPAGVKTIGKDAFKGCSKLTIYAPANSVAYKYAVQQKMKVKKN